MSESGPAERGSEIASELRDEYGDSVRTIATYDKESYTVHYSEDDVDQNYSEEEIEKIYDDVVLQEVGKVFQEELLHDMGDIVGKFRLFENGTVAHFWPTDGDKGVYVAFDGSADPGVRGLYEITERYYTN
mgnify:FL=1|jgi:hypothetical protein